MAVVEEEEVVGDRHCQRDGSELDYSRNRSAMGVVEVEAEAVLLNRDLGSPRSVCKQMRILKKRTVETISDGRLTASSIPRTAVVVVAEEEEVLAWVVVDSQARVVQVEGEWLGQVQALSLVE